MSFDSPAENLAFAKKFQFPFGLLCDTERTLGKAYGAHDPSKPDYARRISYLIDADGTVIQAFLKVDPKTHTEDVLRILEA